MRQLFQDLKKGEVFLAEVPLPRPAEGELLCQTLTSLISAGTERMLLDFGQAGWLGKARQQPEKVRQVLDKVRADGVLATWNSVNSRLAQALPLGYCNVARVLEAEPAILREAGVVPGQRVVSNSPHAELICTRPTTCAAVPEGVSDQEAAFTVLAAVGLQGVRLAQPTLGEYFAVVGLGLIGLMTVQVLRANGCRVLGLDIDPDKCRLAESFGATSFTLAEGKDPVAQAQEFSKGRLLDGVLITAATKSNQVVSQAAAMCRKRGRIILVGTAGLNLRRSDFYEKELSFQVSCAYGPGRYDPRYEQKGQDYPLAYVRWTMKRNFEAVLDLMADGKLDVKPLISHRFDFEQAPQAFQLMSRREPHLGMVLTYQGQAPSQEELHPKLEAVAPRQASRPVVGVLGAGLYATNTLLPNLAKTNAHLRSIVSRHGSNAALAAKRFGFERALSSEDELWADPEINTVFILTRHNLHAPQVLKALKTGRHVFVEKPLCLTLEELAEIRRAYAEALKQNPGQQFMVGFNRRFAPLVREMKEILAGSPAVKSFVMTVNAGPLPPEHWLLDPKVGGGRIVGEAIHFVDLLRHLAGSPVAAAHLTPESEETPPQGGVISLRFQDGSLGAVHYLTNGPKNFPKERLEVFWEGKALQLDNFKRLRQWGLKPPKRRWAPNLAQDKGHAAAVSSFIQAIASGDEPPLPLEEIWEASEVSLKLAKEVSWGK